MKRRFVSALDGLRSFGKVEVNVEERIQPENCAFTKIVRHGFPDDARCMAYDPVQKLLAIGTGHGTCRIFGELGVDYLLRHETDHAVTHMQFLINEGGLITACMNDMIHLWNFRQKRADIVHSLQLSKESVACIHLPIQSKWVFVGTDKGNVYSVSVGSFQMSSYVINWNKAIDLSCRVHPGAVRQLSTSPTDPSKLVIVFEKGVAVIWNLATKKADRLPMDPPIKSVSWHYDGRQIMTGNADGSIAFYSIWKPTEPTQKSTPHAQGYSGDPYESPRPSTATCRPINQIDWRHNADGDYFIVFSGGMPTEDGLPIPAITLLRSTKSATVLEMDNPILSFLTLYSSPWPTAPQIPHTVVVLLKGDIMFIDLTKENYPCLESPHVMDLHESPVTAVYFHSECPSDLMGALAFLSCKQRKKGFSDRPWPLTGGVGREAASSYQELILTGHKDGAVRFWQSSCEHLQLLYRLKTGSHFERLEQGDQFKDVSHAVNSLHLCPESRMLLVTGQAGQSTLFRFNKSESTNTIAVVTLPSICTQGLISQPSTSSDERPGPSSCREMRRQKKFDSRDTDASTDTDEEDDGSGKLFPFKVRGVPVKRSPGFQPELACLLPWASTSKAPQIQIAALNSAYGVIAIASSGGLALIDIAQCALIYAWATSSLYGAEPTPSVQLPSQSSDASPPYSAETTISTSGAATTMKTMTMSCSAQQQQSDRALCDVERPQQLAGTAVRVPQRAKTFAAKPNRVAAIFRRNTSEMVRESQNSTARQKLGGIAHGDGTNEAASPAPSTPAPSKAGSIIRRLTAKKKASPLPTPPSPALTHAPAATSPTVLARSHSFHDGVQALETEATDRGDSSRDSPRDVDFSGSRSARTAPSPTSSLASFERLSSSNARGVESDEDCVSSLQFIHSSIRKNDGKSGASLWVGTSTGAALGLSLLLPADRLISTVVVAPSGTVIKCRGHVLHIAFMDSSFCLLAPAVELFRDQSRDSPEQQTNNRVKTKTSVSPTLSSSIDSDGPQQNGTSTDISQVAIVVSEWEIRVIALPTFALLFNHKREDLPLVKASTSHVGGQPVLMVLSAAGHVMVFSLPSLRPLLFHQVFKHSLDIDDPVLQRTAFSEHGLGVYMASNSEIEKFTVCAEMGEQVEEALGELFVPADMPEQPKQTSLLKGGLTALFSASSRQDTVDLDILFSDKDKAPSATTSMRSVAKTIPGPSMSMDRAHSDGISAGVAAQMALQNLSERGERLNQAVDATENLKNSAQNLSKRTGKLVEQFQKKKWYNL